MKDGTRVKVARIIDSAYPDIVHRIGQIGTVIGDNDGKTVATMIQVEFRNCQTEAFWPEELQEIS